MLTIQIICISVSHCVPHLDRKEGVLAPVVAFKWDLHLLRLYNTCEIYVFTSSPGSVAVICNARSRWPR